MKIALVAAIAENNGFGYQGGMPWLLKGELTYFKAITMNHAVIMGRKTYDSLPFRPLKGRHNIVISRKNTPVEGAALCHSFSEAMDEAQKWDSMQTNPNNIAMVIGGAEILRLTIKDAHIFYRTLVRCKPKADVYFDGFYAEDWQKTETIIDQATEDDNIGYVIEKWIKK